MRLIDADIFKEYVMKGFQDNEGLLKTEEYRNLARQIAEAFCRDIDEQPTAYDIDKIIELLEAEKTKAGSESYCRIRYNNGECADKMCFECITEYLIAIVKGAGKSDNR